MGEITLKGFECERCQHQWVPREEDYPRVCPKCKSPYWDKPRKKQELAFKEKRKLR
jgi:hypothetical protein